ncbi:TonB-dependent receptor [Olivibacter sp. SDN3]|uniref:TonB-dependent receptor n=1 Tax=Olivibacter sp. SDN3 TaxID=2764720 RepID=UPI001650F738|nr:TonB-dependent receptor [Olivibacter sp. SDN3]QNL51802.1 TonB-dependent receptor [Olivibacter sp. SDN3]
MKRYITLLFLALISLPAASQQKITISGHIKDHATGEALIGATIQVQMQGKKVSTLSNAYGFYSLTVPVGSNDLVARFVGFIEQQLTVNLQADTLLNFQLRLQDQQLDEIEVVSTREVDPIASPQMGVNKISATEINRMPVLFGERDLVKALQLMPGVKDGGEGNGAMFVRGGGADQNLVLLDEALVYNPDHLMGFFSTFNTDAIKDVTLYKGSMPATYGGRLSSVLDVRMKEGDNQNYKVNGGIGLISSRLNVEGPIVKNKGSFLMSGRRTYADLFLRASSDPNVNNNQLYFYDLNLKANYTLSSKDKLYVSGYLGRDRLGLRDLFGLNWGNSSATLRWNRQVSPKVFSNASLIYSDYRYDIDLNTASVDGSIKSRIRDMNLKEELSIYANGNNTITVGFNTMYHHINPGHYSGAITLENIPSNYSLENAVYASNSWKASDRLSVDYGLRVSAFSVLGGEQEFYTLNENDQIIGINTYSSGRIVQTYINPEPRLSAAFTLNEISSIKASYTRNAQYLHLISNTGAGNPTDKWVPVNNNIRPGTADMFAAGYVRQFDQANYTFSAESYYKNMHRQIDYKDGANILSNEPIDPQLLYGRGRAYGVELLLRKNTGKLTGWLGYTLSRTELQIDGINGGNWYNARQDRTHDISVVAMYQLSKKWNLSAVWVYNTGNAVTFPSGKYRSDGQVVYYYTERNGYRMPAYHRLDLSATYTLQSKKRYSSELNFGLYNAYGRANALAISFRESPDDPDRTEALRTALFRFVPSISYNFKF